LVNLLIGFFDSALLAVLVLYALYDLGLTPVGLGLLLTAASLGDIVGAFLARPAADRLGIGPTIIGGAALVGIAGVLFPLASGTDILAAITLGSAELLFRLGALVYSVNQLSLRQAIVPAQLLGRVNATMRVIVQGVAPVGALVGGLIGELLGLRTTLIVVAFGFIVAAPCLVISPIRLVRSQPPEAGAPW
jgi:MFS family permease